MPSSGGDHCCLPLRQPSWMRSLLRKKVTISDVPEELLLHILSLVPRKYLVLSCRRVCSRWRDLVDLPILWKHKCRRMGFRMEGSDSGLPDWMTFCFRQSQRNLVKNPCGEAFFDFWESENQPHWEVSKHVLLWDCTQFYERCLRIPHPLREIQRCFVCNRSGIKRQRITLREEGYSDRLMDESRPKIIVKDWHYYSWKCHSQLRVKLLSAGLEVLQECTLPNAPFHHGLWDEISHTFEGYPSGVRHIDLEHKVEATDLVKITGTRVTIDPEGTQEEGAATAEKSGFPNIFNLCLPAMSRL
ncbi:F-box only protein 44 [Anolis carolinensis]|uniref:F-box domain-containing protein n=1 Tax=Anolis carolinensis TaxID=28377 RepID=H9GNA1_ANOCA|nr:PREDICTED: F-box only protein 44 isoform X2 [Anolis carolinensis]|eukprot:XP_008121570.1 PREDICTED: F-box only protein 44 isoform X2 [Anolis carolinensis]